MSRNYGAISMQDYHGILRGKRSRRRLRILGAIAFVGLCCFGAAAGKYWNVWGGKNIQMITANEALRMLEEGTDDDAKVRYAMGALARCSIDTLQAMEKVARRRDAEGLAAAGFIGSLTFGWFRKMAELEEAGFHQGTFTRSGEAIRAELMDWLGPR